MGGPKPDPLRESESDRNNLERLVHQHSTSQQLALRGCIVLEANAGKSNSQIRSLTNWTSAWKRCVPGANGGAHRDVIFPQTS
ncbi:MAG: hypothetical protein JO031_11430 [Ktedonobacteraceae bacterium]|nr:hypothetical protein [Ktedonobacteraceae bacterium]